MTKNTIDINQRIPLHVLHTALVEFLDGNYSNEYVLEQLRLDFEGENRLKKALRIVNKTIPNNPIIQFATDNKEELNQALKRKGDRDLILIALFNVAFPFSYQALRFFGKFFAVQDVVNSELIKKSLTNLYGGNRATENGMYSVIPMMVEAQLIIRIKTGVYKMVDKTVAYSPIAIRIFEESFKWNNSVVSINANQSMDPYFEFIN